MRVSLSNVLCTMYWYSSWPLKKSLEEIKNFQIMKDHSFKTLKTICWQCRRKMNVCKNYTSCLSRGWLAQVVMLFLVSAKKSLKFKSFRPKYRFITFYERDEVSPWNLFYINYSNYRQYLFVHKLYDNQLCNLSMNINSFSDSQWTIWLHHSRFTYVTFIQ